MARAPLGEFANRIVSNHEVAEFVEALIEAAQNKGYSRQHILREITAACEGREATTCGHCNVQTPAGRVHYCIQSG